ncbi:MAG: hypothetical protein GH143_08040 [Calditrichaeota bacterium]|nr:hypothetical protein [Calditrichota bacterium]
MSNGKGWFALAIAALSTLSMFSGCQEELDIAEFADEYGDYEPELRIEAILDVVEPSNSIVRVDRTILVTDTTIFNGRDDDGDWDPLVDDVGEDGVRAADMPMGGPDEGEGNGRPDPGEPHVDEIDEILPQIHDTTVAVILWDLTVGSLVLDFAWNPEADSFTIAVGSPEGFNIGAGDERLEVVTYGAYKPTAVYDIIAIDHEYEFQITTNEHQITGTVHPLPPPVFDVDTQVKVGDTLQVALGGLGQLTWTTAEDATVYWVLVEEVLGPDSLRTVVSHPAAPIEQSDDGSWIGREILSLFLPGLYRWTVSVPSRAYGAYVYSQLPMRDEQVSNLRDENGKVVLGIAGSAASASQYVRILDF